MSMLAPESMIEANLFVLEPDLEAVTGALARMEALHLEDVVPEGWTPSPEWTELANRYSGLAQRLGEMRRDLGCGPVLEAEPASDLHPAQDWREIELRLVALEGRVQSWQRRRKESGLGVGQSEARRVAGPAPASSRRAGGGSARAAVSNRDRGHYAGRKRSTRGRGAVSDPVHSHSAPNQEGPDAGARRQFDR